MRDGAVRAIVPLFENEVRGVPMLQRLCDAIFEADGEDENSTRAERVLSPRREVASLGASASSM